MALYDIKGRVVEVGIIQSFSSGFTKRDIIVDTRDEKSKYDNPVKFTATKDDCALLDGIRPGDSVAIKFAIDGRKWEGGAKGVQYFVDLKLKKIVNESAGRSSAPAAANPPMDDALPAEDDQMPF